MVASTVEVWLWVYDSLGHPTFGARQRFPVSTTEIPATRLNDDAPVDTHALRRTLL